jgi:hypothetical protein
MTGGAGLGGFFGRVPNSLALWALVQGRVLIRGIPFRGGLFGRNSPSVLATKFLNDSLMWLFSRADLNNEPTHRNRHIERGSMEPAVRGFRLGFLVSCFATGAFGRLVMSLESDGIRFVSESMPAIHRWTLQ